LRGVGRPAQNRDPASRRSTVALSAQEPLRTRHYLRIRPGGCSRPAIAHGGLRHRAFRSRLYGPRSTPHPAPPSGSSPETPLHERGWQNVIYIRYVVNKYLRFVAALPAPCRAQPHGHAHLARSFRIRRPCASERNDCSSGVQAKVLRRVTPGFLVVQSRSSIFEPPSYWAASFMACYSWGARR
jgi:hypothetical protein